MKRRIALNASFDRLGMAPNDNSPATWHKKIHKSLTFWIVLSTVLGVILGSAAPEFSKAAAPTANIFLRPIQFIVFPLVFSSLVVGISSQDDLHALGRLSLKSFIYFEIITVAIIS
jgi:proton glutamate symport protein